VGGLHSIQDLSGPRELSGRRTVVGRWFIRRVTWV